MKLKKISIILIGIITLNSCLNEKEKEAKETVESFIEMVQKGDTAMAFKIYPTYKYIQNPRKISKYKISSIKTEDDIIAITIKDKSKEGGNNTSNNDGILFLVKPNEDNKTQIINSDGLYISDDIVEDYRLYNFLLRTGLQTNNIKIMDIQKGGLRQVALNFSDILVNRISNRFKKEVKVLKWDWRKFGANSRIVSIDAKIRSSKTKYFDIIKYKVDFFNSSGDKVLRKTGDIIYLLETIYSPSGEIRTCCINMNDINCDVTTADFSVYLDKEIIRNEILNKKDYKGDEMDLWLKKNGINEIIERIIK